MFVEINNPRFKLVHRYYKNAASTVIQYISHSILMLISLYLADDWKPITKESINITNISIQRVINTKYYSDSAVWNISQNNFNTKVKLVFGPKIIMEKHQHFYNQYGILLEINNIGSGCIGFKSNQNEYICYVMIDKYCSFGEVCIETIHGTMQHKYPLARPLENGDQIIVGISIAHSTVPVFLLKIKDNNFQKYEIRAYKTCTLMLEILQELSVKLRKYQFASIST